MGFFSEFKKAATGKPAGDRYRVAGTTVSCAHCSGSTFFEKEALLDGRGASLLGIEAFGDAATALICTQCGHIEWFADQNLIERM